MGKKKEAREAKKARAGTVQRIERRQSSFTDAVLLSLLQQANGTQAGSPLEIAALEMAAGQYARAFAGAMVNAPARIKAALNPSVLALIARDILRRGESIHMIDVEGGRVRLLPAGTWDVRGGWEKESWAYRLDLFGPSGNITRLVPEAAVVHCMYSYDAARPWLGLSPLQWAKSTGTLAANLEARLGQEAGGPVGYLYPVPLDSAPGTDDAPGPLDLLRKDLDAMRGEAVLVSTTSSGWEQGKDAAPHQDWIGQRVGARIPEANEVLRTSAGRAILGACGCPPGLFETAGSGQESREAWRRFVYGSVQPVAALVAEELSRKLDASVALDFKELRAEDTPGLAASYKKYKEGGLSDDDAMKATFLSVVES